MENRLERVIEDFNTIANQFETDYLENFREEPTIHIVLGKSELVKLICGAFCVDNHEVESINFDGDLRVVLKKIEE